MHRRRLIALLGVAITAPRALRAQQKPMPVIGYLNGGSPEANPNLAAFHQGLRETGWVEGRNVAIEYRWAEFRYDRLPALAADLVGRKVDVIAACGGAGEALVAKNATSTIPIVVATMGDPPASLPTSRGRAATSPDCRSSKRSLVPNGSICCGKWSPG